MLPGIAYSQTAVYMSESYYHLYFVMLPDGVLKQVLGHNSSSGKTNSLPSGTVRVRLATRGLSESDSPRSKNGNGLVNELTCDVCSAHPGPNTIALLLGDQPCAHMELSGLPCDLGVGL